MREITYGLAVESLKPGSRISHMGREGTVVMVDTENTYAGCPVILMTWDDEPAPSAGDSLRSSIDFEYVAPHWGHAEGEWFYACEACSGLPDSGN